MEMLDLVTPRIAPRLKSAAAGFVLAAAIGLAPCFADAQSFTDRARRDETAAVPSGMMDAAFAAARADLPGFLALAASPPPGTRGFAVKIGLRNAGGGDPEFFWITQFTRLGQTITGTLTNTPRHVRGYREGQRLSFVQAEIVDWMFIDAEGRMRGNRTACVLLEQESVAAREEFRRAYGLDCARAAL